MTTNDAPKPEETITGKSTITAITAYMSLRRDIYPPYAHMDDASLLSKYAWWDEQLGLVQEQKGHLQQEIYRRIAERGATGIPDETFSCEVVTTYAYDQKTLTPFLEMLNNVELAKCYEPAYTPEPVEVPAKWKIQQLIAVAKRRGAEALSVVDRARIETGRKLRFERSRPA